MNIGSLSTNVFYIDANQKFSKKLNLRIDDINKENISDKSTDRFGREVNYPSSEAGYFMTSDHYKYNEIPQDYYLNSYANSNLINTKFGKEKLFLDLAGDNDQLRVGGFSSNSQLFRFDSDSNGIIDKKRYLL
ncbi:hypothetical protein HHI31_04110 [Campylobacter fetus subsp. venerealis]|uniref:hypothetical protein n=1 Tax=Campylobacter fetus TaxID=196 RepID=UPI0018E7173C|nr:hypothetical protein [Campylobacter fetus]QQF52053.1 hypothetical protein HHI31_04110 [Campylobacter fetus subsp. venerealis]